jgi:hypothetical protein
MQRPAPPGARNVDMEQAFEAGWEKPGQRCFKVEDVDGWVALSFVHFFLVGVDGMRVYVYEWRADGHPGRW